MTESAFKTRRIAVTSSGWTPLVCPASCDWLEFANQASGTVQVRTDDDLDESEWALSAGGVFVCHVPNKSTRKTRFNSGDVVAYFRAVDPETTGYVVGFFTS